MSLELQQLSEDAAAARALREQLASSETVIALSPDLIDASFVNDRMPIDDDPAFEELKAAISDKGQQVPILVRPHPERSGRYQIAYGRRRLRAANELGLAVKAIVRELTDRDLVVAQAQENGPRADLSFIERALFAVNLTNHGFDRETTANVLGIDKPELSRLLTVATAITPEIIAGIGPAPKIGRPRWLSLAEKLGEPGALNRAKEALKTEAFKRADTNGRFGVILKAATALSPPTSGKVPFHSKEGKAVVWVERTRRGIRLVSDEPGFAVFLESRLPSLVREFEAPTDQEELKSD